MRKLGISVGLVALAILRWQGQYPMLGVEAPLNAQLTSEFQISTRLSQALAHYRGGDYTQAIAHWQSLLNDPQVKRDRLLLGQLWNYLSLGQQKLSQWDAATRSIRKSLSYLAPSSTAKTSTQQQQHYAQALTTQGQLQLELGDDITALETWKQSEQVYRRLGDSIGVRGSLMNQALALEQGGFFRRACFTILEAVRVESQCDFSEGDRAPILAAFSRAGEPQFQMIALHTFSKILLNLGEVDFAAIALDAAQTKAQPFPALARSLAFTEASIAMARYQSLKQEESRARTRRLAQGLQTQVIGQASQTQQQYEALLNAFNSPPQRPNSGESWSSAHVQYPIQVDYFAFLTDYMRWLETKHLDTTVIAAKIQTQFQQLQPPRQASHRSALFAQIKHAESLISLIKYDPSRYHFVKTKAFQLLKQVIQTESTPVTRAFAYGALGQLYELQQQWPQAQQVTELALRTVRDNPDVSYRWQWQLGRILAAQGQRDRAIQAYEQALVALQTIRQDLLSLKRDAQLSFRDQIEPSYRELVALLLDDANPTAQTLSQARRVIDRLQVSEVEDFLLQNCITASLASLDSYIERQAPSSALVYTIVQDEYLDIIVKIPGTNEIKFHRVPQTRTQLNEFLRNYRRSLQTKLPSAKRDSQQHGQQLYQWLIEPFLSEFQKRHIDTLIFVLDGGLRDIPMATLYSGQRYLVQDYAIAVTPGLQVLEASRQVVQSPQALVAGASEGDRRLGLPALPAVKREIQQIQSTLPLTEVLLDDAFTTRSFQSSLQASTASIIHIATHGQFSSNPEETFIVTGSGERLNIDELGGLLRQRTRAQTLELLFLSACQTLAGDRWAALGMAGMAIRSGAQSTIASIWNADDEASAELVTRFYAKLTEQQGRSKAEALRLAQMEVLENPRYELPVYWSPYVLIGNWQ